MHSLRKKSHPGATVDPSLELFQIAKFAFHTGNFMNHDHYSEEYILDILNSVRTVAVVGASLNNVRPSYFVVKYLISKGYEVFPVNPGQSGKSLFGRLVHEKIEDIDAPIDMVDIFRNSEAAAEITNAALVLKPIPKVIWMQLSVRNDAAAKQAEKQGVKVVMNRCPKIEYGKLSGEIGWSGVNSKKISAKKPIMRPGFQQLGIRKSYNNQ